MNNKDENNINNILVVFLKCIKLLFSYSKAYVVLTIFANVVLGILPALSLILMQKILNQLQLGSIEISLIVVLIIMYVAIDLCNAIITALYNYYTTKISLHLGKSLTVKLLDKALKLKIEDFENTEIYNMINRAQSEGNSKIISFYTSIIAAFKALISIFSSLMILMTFELWIIIPILIIPIIEYIFSLYFSKLQYNIQKKRTTKERKAWYITHLITTGIAFKEIRVYKLKKYILEKYQKLTEEIIDQDMNVVKKSSIIFCALDIVDLIVSGLIFFYIVFKGALQVILVGDVITYTRCIFNIRSYIKSIFNVISSVARNSLFAGLYFDFLDLELDIKDELDGIILNSIDNIEVRNLSYKYARNSKYTIKDISFKLTKGKIFALVGNNGSGKSTLIKLLLGFYDDYEGQILYNGIDVKKISKNSLYALLGTLFQDYIKYEATVRENVAYGNIDALHNDSKIIEKLKSVHFNFDLINKLELETQLGYWFDDGKQLSMGEWQKIAIARTTLKDCDFYMLDEPDASLDINAQHDILQLYKDISKRKICMIVSHKIDYIGSFADEVIVLEKGVIIEQGRYEELIAKEKSYLNKAKRNNIK